METLAYLHLAQDYENPESKELHLEGLKNTALAGALGVACVASAMGVVAGTADTASAHPYYRYGGYHASYGYGYYPRYYGYYPRYRSYYYPAYGYGYRSPCYYPYYRY
jgi:hypothetical protein